MSENPVKNETDIEKFSDRHPANDMPVPTNSSLTSIMQVAIQKSYAPEIIEKMMELSERHEANQAKKAFTKAMAAFKSDPPSIFKDKTNKQFGAKYSSIEALVNPAIPYLSKCGLSHSWQYGEPDPKQVVVTCTITHELGHSESVKMSAPPDTSGGNSKNPIQQIKSTQTYLKIATFEAVTGLVSQEANLNDDGNASGAGQIEYINIDMVTEINDLIKSTKSNKAKFLKYIKAPSVDKIPLSAYGKVVATFKAKADATEKDIPEPGSGG